MACASHVLVFLLFSHVALAMAATPYIRDTCASKCHSSCEEELNLTLYLHQAAAGANQNQKVIVNPGFPNGFGMLAVNDWTVLDAPKSSASIVARAKGMHLQATQSQSDGVDWFFPFSIVFQDSRFGGSTLQVMGTISAPNGEWAIVGGTGKLSMARGTIKYTIVLNVADENYRKIDIHAFYTPSSAA